MNKTEVIKHLILNNKRIKRAYDILLKLNPKLTVKENADALGMSTISVVQFCRGHHIKCAKANRGQFFSHKRKQREEFYRKNWCASETITQNAKRLKLSRNSVYHAVRAYSLPYIKKTKHKEMLVVGKMHKSEMAIKAKALFRLRENQLANPPIVPTAKPMLLEIKK